MSKSKFSAILKARPETAGKLKGRAGQGKSSNPDYVQVTAYIPAELHLKTKVKLLLAGKREFSDLVTELLEAWNRNKPDA